METLIWLCRYSQQQSCGWVGLSAAASIFAWLLVTLHVFCAGELQQVCQRELAKFTSLDVTADGSRSIWPRSTPILLCHALSPAALCRDQRLFAYVQALKPKGISAILQPDFLWKMSPGILFRSICINVLLSYCILLRGGWWNSRSTFISVR